MKRITNILSTVSEESTVEELRRVIADVTDVIPQIESDITGYNSTIEQLTTDNANNKAEIDRLREENGRLFRERIIEKADEQQPNSLDTEEEIKRLQEQIKF